jgi:hypothetical protein
MLLIWCSMQCIVHTVVIVIGGLKSRGLAKTHIVCTIKISPVETPTIPRLSMLRDDQKSIAAYLNFR